ncbi:MAG: DUF1674 domain-containing protein [Pseudomonadota bacterium]
MAEEEVQKTSEDTAPRKPLSAAARRALDEAAARRKAAAEEARAKEINGPKGEEPTRYGDWERKGVAYDF